MLMSDVDECCLQVEPALVDEVSRSPAKCDATHTDSKSPGTNMLPVGFRQLHD